MKKEAKEKYVEFNVLQQQLEQMQKYTEELEGKLAEFHAIKESLSELASVKVGAEILVPLASGVFAKAQLRESGELLVNVGANVAVTKSLPQVIDIIHKQIVEVRDIHEKLSNNIVSITERLNVLIEEIKE